MYYIPPCCSGHFYLLLIIINIKNFFISNIFITFVYINNKEYINF